MKIKHTHSLIIIILLAMVLLGEFLFIFAVPKAINLSKHQAFIENFFNKKTDANLQFKDIELKTYADFSVGINAQSLVLTDADNKVMLDAEKPYIRIALLPLIFKNIEIKTVSADKLFLDVLRDKQGRYNLESLIFKSDKKIFKLKFKRTKLNISNYYVSFNDEFINKKFKAQGNYFKISDFTMKKLINFETDGIISSNDFETLYQLKVYSKLPLRKHIDDSNFVISGFVKDFNPSYFMPYIQNYTDKDTQNIDGKASFNFYTKKSDVNDKKIIIEGTLDDLYVKNKNPENDIIARGKNILFGKFTLDKNEINVEDLYIKNANYSLLANGSIKNYKNKKPIFDMSVEIPKSNIEEILNLLPANLVPGREEIRKIKMYKMFGDIQGNLKIQGKVPQPNLTGDVRSDNLKILNKNDNSHIGDVKLNFDKRKLNLDIKVSMPNSEEWVTVKGITHIYRDNQNHIVVKTSQKVPIAVAIKVLLPIRDVFLFQLGPVPQMKITAGTGETELDILGTKESGVVVGHILFNNATASYNGINAEITDATGRVDFYGKKITYKTTRGHYKKYPISIYGTAVVEDDMDINIDSDSVDAAAALEIINTSPLLEEIKQGLAVITTGSGLCEFRLKLKSKTPPPNSDPVEFINNLKVSGSVKLKDVICSLEGFRTPIKQVKGLVTFTDANVKLQKLNGIVESSPIEVYGNIDINKKTNIPTVDIYVKGNKIQGKDAFKFLTESDVISNFQVKPQNIDMKSYNLNNLAAQLNLNFNYKATAKDMDLNGISLTADFVPQKSNKNFEINSGKIILNKSNIKLENINSKINNSNINLSGTINNIYSQEPDYNINIQAIDFNVKAIEELLKSNLFPKNLKTVLSKYSNFSGKANISANLNKKEIKGQIDLNQVSFIQKQLEIPISINDTSIKISNNKLIAKPLTAVIGSSPLYAEIVVADLLENPTINGYFTTKITDDLVDPYINSKLTYPIKVKGDITLSCEISGNSENLSFTSKIKLNEGADISYLSTNLGDTYDTRELNGSISLTPKNLFIKKLDYIKYQTSQNNKVYPMNFATLRASFVKKGNAYLPESFYIKTNNNLPARLLNFAFKKSILKKGTFSGALFYKANTGNETPKILGNMDFKNIDIPLYDTIIKDISINSNKDTVTAIIKGTTFDSDLTIKSSIINKLSFPIIIKQLDISSVKFNFDKILATIDQSNLETYQNKTSNSTPQSGFEVSNFLIENGSLKADDVVFKTLPAKNMSAKFSLSEKSILNISDIYLDIAGGTLEGESEYNFKTDSANAELKVQNVDANPVATAFFDMKNQIFGRMNGYAYLDTNGKTSVDRLENLSGRIYFNLRDGKMPKLGSLEYLLRASNLIKSGITGLTINSIIDIINPVKTGSFSTINGGFKLTNGLAEDIQIFSKGDNLSIYVSGKYDLVNSNADMKILGKLSKKVPTILGPLGNTSLNTFLNAIPGLKIAELDRTKFTEEVAKIPNLGFSNDDYRIFQAKIDGNINGSSYVTSFKWVE